MKMCKYSIHLQLTSKKFPKEVLRFFNSPRPKSVYSGKHYNERIYEIAYPSDLRREPAKAVLVDGKKQYMPMSKFKRLMERGR